MAMKANTLAVFNYLKEHDGEKMTSQDIADALHLDRRVVDGCVTRGLAIESKGLAVRSEPVEVTLADGTKKKVKFISLTDKGRSFDPDASEEG